jgi:hypothetical protein
MGALTGPTSCGGIKGWVEARYPPTKACPGERSDFLTSFGIEQMESVTADMRVTAHLARGTSDLAASRLVIRPSESEPPILRVGSLSVDIDGARIGALVEQTSVVVAKDVHLLNDAVVIGAIISRARTTTDGIAGTAEASVTFADVEVTVSGEHHEAVVDEEGIRVDDPDLSNDQAISLSETINDALLQAGISISSAAPVEITEGAAAEASAGGLTIALSGTVPAVPVPREVAQVLAPVIEQIPTRCVREITHGDDAIPNPPPPFPEVPLCFGAGVLPGPGSQLVATVNIANASSFSVASAAPTFPAPPPFNPPSFTPPTGVGPGGFTPPATSFPPVAGEQGTSVNPPAPTVNAPVVGLVSKIPDWSLALAGGLMLAFAFGLMVAPSLRHARAG